MLIPTNDAFLSVDAADLPRGKREELVLSAPPTTQVQSLTTRPVHPSPARPLRNVAARVVAEHPQVARATSTCCRNPTGSEISTNPHGTGGIPLHE